MVPYGRAIAQRIKATLGITGLSPPRVHIDGEVWHLDVGSSHPGVGAGPKRFLLVEFVDGDFGQPVLAVGFQQGKLRLFQTALLLLAAVRGGLLLVLEFGGGFLQSNDVV